MKSPDIWELTLSRTSPLAARKIVLGAIPVPYCHRGMHPRSEAARDRVYGGCYTTTTTINGHLRPWVIVGGHLLAI